MFKKKKKTDNLKLLSFRLHENDVAKLDLIVSQLKRKGHRHMNRSRVLRYAIRTLNVDETPDSVWE